MSLIAIGDTHGRNDWKKIIEIEKDLVDTIIFIGDYFDTHDQISPVEQIYNFLEIIKFKKKILKKGKQKVIILIGNHDYHYLPGINETYPGYNIRTAPEISRILKENLQYLQICYEENGFLFSHAGITKTWIKDVEITNDENLVKNINELFEYKPLSFKFNGFNSFGDNITQGPLWVRPLSLSKDGISTYIQVIGHTQVKKLGTNTQELSNKCKLYLIDCLGTSKEYLKIHDNVSIEMKKIQNADINRKKI